MIAPPVGGGPSGSAAHGRLRTRAAPAPAQLSDDGARAALRTDAPVPVTRPLTLNPMPSDTTWGAPDTHRAMSSDDAEYRSSASAAGHSPRCLSRPDRASNDLWAVRRR
ncbi:MAG: hypothetical protein LBE67_17615 [Kocuria palustris]|nr:hypothetical protein [Kocuria palustris]